MKILKRYSIHLIIMTILISFIAPHIIQADNSALDKLNNLYRLQGQINKNMETKEARLRDVDEIMEKVSVGFCSQEDILMGTYSREEMKQRYNDEIEDIKYRIIEMEKQMVTTDNMVKLYTQIYNTENRNVTGLVKQYLNTSKSLAGGELKLSLPLTNIRVTSPYGMRTHPILKTSKIHNGIDLAEKEGTPIYSVESGVVIKADLAQGYGNTVVVMHRGGYFSLYAHIRNNGIKVKVGDTVAKGQKIAEVGSTGLSTGNHLHFELFVNGSRVNPENYIRFR